MRNGWIICFRNLKRESKQAFLVCVSVIGLSFSSRKNRVFSLSQFRMEKPSVYWCVAYPIGRSSILEPGLPRMSARVGSLSFRCRVSEDVRYLWQCRSHFSNHNVLISYLSSVALCKHRSGFVGGGRVWWTEPGCVASSWVMPMRWSQHTVNHLTSQLVHSCLPVPDRYMPKLDQGLGLAFVLSC